ncbi:hypothetical protein FYK55_09810 [Roseiconus nitratireducens]|uniref:Uncharacterized protein n=1 Tax=Roseiconus nitratireducens TaxID=2605748 RepID=A0A5M6DEJ3_9BACT|nr:hypothetical protein [Roseiconus nitratireducens]KAA5544599.1 hypothetical protein FYK55_09810 [Roseiconus nitratireducens]
MTDPTDFPISSTTGSHPTDGAQMAFGPSDNRDPHRDAPASRPHPPDSGLGQGESMREIIGDVEQFTRGWIGRIRDLLQRSSQLIERERLLAGAIARLDRQQSEWSKRTQAKEATLEDQSKLLTEAWLSVESERRRTIQGNKAAAAGASAVVSPTIPAQTETSQSEPANGVSPPAAETKEPTAPAASTPDSPAVTTDQKDFQADPAARSPVPPPNGATAPVASQTPLPNRVTATQVNVADTFTRQRPVQCSGDAGSTSATGQNCTDPERMEAITRERIERFRRMQRAIRSSRNK